MGKLIFPMALWITCRTGVSFFPMISLQVITARLSFDRAMILLVEERDGRRVLTSGHIIGDSFIVTETGNECLSKLPNDITVV
jgi:hypothetical protein